ncbi:MAG: MBL fold metallo-hydrolase RNA specificity domain-containing protein, partial [Candidatus Micrarchaeota archaeon]|nr:MBL fold metallo-hydrolase RNA specificity domain-containing protein [Candidatus Micrarchaeota archaeon]
AYGYEGPVYCTPPTRDLTILLQQDCMKVMNAEGKGCPYGEKDIKKQLNHMIVRDYGEVTDVTPEVRFTFHNAGHILGSAQVHLHVGEGLHNLVFSADIKYGRTSLLDPADTRFPRVETLLIESTYGGKHDILPRYDECEERIAQTVREITANRGKVLIPVFAVGRAQELMVSLESRLQQENIPIYIDGMSKEASAIHTVYPEYLRQNVQRRILQNNSPFDNPMFKHASSKERKAIVESEEPCVILAPSGMLSGGSSVEYLKMMAHDPKNALLFVGYQGALTLGRRIQSGEREVPMLNEKHKLDTLKINLQVQTIDGYSGHSDRSQLLAYLRNLRPKPTRVFTMHGDEAKTDEFARVINRMMHIETRAPMNLDSIRLR